MTFPSYPTATHTWTVDNRITTGYPTPTDHNKMLLLNLKAALVAVGWTIVNSCDGTAVGVGDLWLDAYGNPDPTKLVWYWTPYNHSWMQFTDGFQWMVFDLVSSYAGGQQGTLMDIKIADTPFTGGAVNARPTNANEFTLLARDGCWGGQIATTTQKTYVWRASDDGRTRVIMTISGGSVWQYYFIDWQHYHTNGYDETPNRRVYACKTLIPNYANINAMQNLLAVYATESYPIAIATIGYGGTSGTQIGSQSFHELCPYDSSYDYVPIMDAWTYSSSTVGIGGKIDDLWVCGSAVASADTFNSRALVTFGNLVYPWDGSTPV
jgi:hypothetical protein